MSIWRSNLKVTYRSFLRQKGYASINLVGLVAGLTCFVLIVLYGQHEYSYDRFHEEADRIFRVTQRRPASGGSEFWPVTSPAIAPHLMERYSAVRTATTVGPLDEPVLVRGEERHQVRGIFADERFFELFSFELRRGDPRAALSRPDGLVLTHSLAERIFGEEDPMGKRLVYGGARTHAVTGVVEDPPETSHLRFAFILPATASEYYTSTVEREIWYNNGVLTYVLLAEGAGPEDLEAQLRAFVGENLSDRRPEDHPEYVLQPLTEIHLRSGHMSAHLDVVSVGDVRYVYLLVAVGMLILLLACVNYTNLAVARYLRRRVEVGIRRTVGAQQWQLVGQFLGESVLLTLLALGLAMGLVHLLLPVFGHLMERPLAMNYLENLLLLPALISLAVLVGLLAGSYPAVFMGVLPSISALEKRGRSGRSRSRLQRVLIVGQYAASIALVVCSLVIYQQMGVMRDADVGYQREQVLTVKAEDPGVTEHFATIREGLLRTTGTSEVAYSAFLPTEIMRRQFVYGWSGSDEDETVSTVTTSVDYGFLDVYDVQVVAGRNFSRSFGGDTLGAPIALINEEAAAALGWLPEEAVGRQFGFSDGRGVRRVVGVVENFHFNSVRQPVRPLVLTLERPEGGFLSARIGSEEVSSTIAAIERTIGRFSSIPIRYQFLDQHVDRLYEQEARLGETIGFFTVLALLIASLGLFGLAAYSAEQRTKEVGVRKVLGASVLGLATLLSRDFLGLVAAAFLVGAPVAYLVMNEWLSGFVYRTEMGPGLFVAAGFMAFAIALMSVGYQAVTAALADPVRSLRSD